MKTLIRKAALMPKTIPAHPVTLLKIFELDYRRNNGRNGRPQARVSGATMSFWMREQHQLHEILHDVQQSHRALVLRYHPDKPGGDNAKCAYVNAAFDKVKKLFAQKGVSLC